MTPVHFVTAAVGCLLLGFFIQKAVMDSGRGKLLWWIPMLITALCLLATGALMIRYNTGEETLMFLLWFFASAILLFLLIGMILGRLIGHILGKANS